MADKIMGYLVDTEKKTSGKVEIVPNLETYYSLLNCDLIDIVTRKIGGRYYDIIVDDEGLFKSEPKISAQVEDGSFLVGNLLVLGTPDADDEEGKETGLTEFDIRRIANNVRFAVTKEGISPILWRLEY